MGPENPFSRQLHAEKYRADGESYDDYTVRYARATADRDDVGHFRQLLDALRNMRLLPAGRQQIAVGRPYQTTGFNCFRGDIEIMTDRGFRPLYELVKDEQVAVLSPVSGQIEVATARSYGEQPLNRIRVSRTWRGERDPFEVYATANHRWVLQDGSVTTELEVGDILKAADCGIPMDPAGFVHGMVFGDGSKAKDDHRFMIRLCGRKTRYLGVFEAAGDIVSVTSPPSVTEGDVLVRLRSAVDLKELPAAGVGLSYLRGFVEGWLAADGCLRDYTRHDGGRQAYIVHSINLEAMSWLYDHIVLAGYAPVGPVKHDDAPTNYGPRSAPLYRFLFRPASEHAGYRVVGIDEAVSIETVYCVEEPNHRQIVLRNGLRSGQCFVMGTIPDSIDGIFEALRESAKTLRSGGGIGMDFSTLRPAGEPVRGLGAGAMSSGPLAFMGAWDAMSTTICSAGMRRGAMMGVLRVDHPDIEAFVRAKRDQHTLSRFNISVAVTDEFMAAVEADGLFTLRFGDRNFGDVRAYDIWSTIMENNWDWAEPGVIFIDTVNRMNPLGYCERIAASNPCMTGDTPLLTRGGYHPIQDLVGQTIEIWNGHEWSFVQPRVTGHDQPIVKVALTNGVELRCTPYHSFILQGGRRVEARDLRPGQKLVNAEMPVIEGPMEVPNAWAQGFFSGDGHMAHGKPWVCLYGEKMYLEHEFASRCRYEQAGPRIMLGLSGVYQPKSFVPGTTWSVRSRLDWLTGLADADGTSQHSYNSRTLSIASIDKAFLHNVRRMMTTLGIRSRMLLMHEASVRLLPDGTGGHAEYSCQECWRLLISANELAALQALGFTTKRIKLAGNHPQRAASRGIAVVSVEPAGVADKVYCFTEPRRRAGVFDGVLTGNCGEQMLPPYGACLLGSLNIVRYLVPRQIFAVGGPTHDLDVELLTRDVAAAVRAFDNVIDRTVYPLPQQEAEAKNKRRMGIGVNGMANALEVLGHPYGSPGYLAEQDRILELIQRVAIETSCERAISRGPFSAFDAEGWLDSGFARTLPDDLRDRIGRHGLRNGQLLSIAPTGTISLCADNASSGIEPPYAIEAKRRVLMAGGEVEVDVSDYAFVRYGVRGRTARDVAPADHVAVQCAAQRWIDSSISKTVNVWGAKAGQPAGAGEIDFKAFKDLYCQAYAGGAKGCTTFNANGKRFGILKPKTDEPPAEGAACYIDDQGRRECA